MSIPFMVGMLASIATAIGAMKSYKIPLAVLVLYLPFNIYVQDLRSKSEAINPVNLLLLLVFVSYIFTGRTSGGGEPSGLLPEKSPIRPYLVAYIGLILTCFVYAKYFSGLSYFMEGQGSPSGVKVWITPLVLYFLYYRAFRTIGEKKIILLIMATSTLIMAAYSIVEYRNIGGYDPDKRIIGFMANSNELSAFLVLYPFVYASMLWCKELSLPYKAYLALCSFFSIGAMALTLSRGAYVSFAVASAFFCFYRSKKLFVLVLILASLYQYVVPKDVMKRIEATETSDEFGNVRLESSAASRFEIWSGALRILSEHPLGIGYGLIPYHMAQQVNRAMDTHNIYLHVLLQLGPFGLIAFMLMLFNLFRDALRKYKATPNDFGGSLSFGFAACVVALVVRGLTGSHFISAEAYNNFWVIAAMVTNLSLRNTSNELVSASVSEMNDIDGSRKNMSAPQFDPVHETT